MYFGAFVASVLFCSILLFLTEGNEGNEVEFLALAILLPPIEQPGRDADEDSGSEKWGLLARLANRAGGIPRLCLFPGDVPEALGP